MLKMRSPNLSGKKEAISVDANVIGVLSQSRVDFDTSTPCQCGYIPTSIAALTTRSHAPPLNCQVPKPNIGISCPDASVIFFIIPL